MGTPEVRSPERILQKSLELFSSRGYDATSVREICQAAGITKPTLYHFYGSKEGVYRALVDGTLEAFNQDVARSLAGPGSVEQRLRRVALGYFAMARGSRELMRFIFGLVHNPSSDAPRTDFHRYYEAVVGQVAACIEDGVTKGELQPGATEVRLLVFMGALGESVCGYVVTGKPEPTPELAEALVDSVLSGWRRSADA